jgi:hypothetical protein
MELLLVLLLGTRLATSAALGDPASHGVCGSPQVAAWAASHAKRQIAFWDAAPHGKPLVDYYLQMRSNVSQACNLAHPNNKIQREFCVRVNLAKLVCAHTPCQRVKPPCQAEPWAWLQRRSSCKS